MVTPSIGEVVLVPFPFSDLSQSKVRPAVCLADAGRGDRILCQITSKPFGDSLASSLDAALSSITSAVVGINIAWLLVPLIWESNL